MTVDMTVTQTGGTARAEELGRSSTTFPGTRRRPLLCRRNLRRGRSSVRQEKVQYGPWHKNQTFRQKWVPKKALEKTKGQKQARQEAASHLPKGENDTKGAKPWAETVSHMEAATNHATRQLLELVPFEDQIPQRLGLDQRVKDPMCGEFETSVRIRGPVPNMIPDLILSGSTPTILSTIGKEQQCDEEP